MERIRVRFPRLLPAQPSRPVPHNQQPPFRPAGRAPTTSSPPQRTDSRPPSQASQASSPGSSKTQASQSNGAVDNKGTSESAAPSPSTASQVPSSPSKAAPETRVVSNLSSPSRTNSKQTTLQSPKSSPKPVTESARSNTSNMGQEPSPAHPQPKVKISTEVAQPDASNMGQEPSPVQPQPKVEISTETSTQPEAAVTEPLLGSSSLGTIATTSLAPPQKSDSIATAESQRRAEETEDKKKEASKLFDEEKKSDAESPVQKKINERMIRPLDEVQNQQQQHKTEESIDKKEMASTFVYEEKEIDADGNTPTRFTRKTVISKDDKSSEKKEIGEETSILIHKMVTDSLNSNEKKAMSSIITMAGDNKGAAMYLGSDSAGRNGWIHIHREYKSNPDENLEDATDREGSSKQKRLSVEDPPTRSFINNNTQSINNSILIHSSITERSPGLHLVQSRHSSKSIRPNGHSKPVQTHKAEFTVTPTEKLTYEPMVRRRCLRGLLMESSDSDLDNPEKPRRHGCRHSCKDTGVRNL